MSAILDFMETDHRDCDARLAALEGVVAKGDLAAAEWSQFCDSMRRHFRREEEVLFPAFEGRTGNTQGPTAVMRMEHEQMRGLLEQLQRAFDSQDKAQFLGLSETLMVLMQQHNMKEEQVLYPMCDQVLEDSASVVEQMRTLPDADQGPHRP